MENTRKQQRRRISPSSSRSAFTLVEMLVSVALVLLMMTMFASIFAMATNSVASQRGIAANDQRARALVTVLESDFSNRTMRFPLPFHAAEDSSTAPAPRASSNGYIYISTNNPDSGHDDILQMTVSTTALAGGTDDSPFFGAATILGDRSAAPMPTSLSINRNQPDADDGVMFPNGTAASAGAEVCYFWRNGNLYRRVVLIREPERMAGQTLGPQPVTRSGDDYFSGKVAGTYEVDGGGVPLARYWLDKNSNNVVDANELSNNFYTDFDFSAVRAPIGSQSAKFLGLDSLGNGLSASGAAVESLGNPIDRFGFDNLGVGVGPKSREYDNSGMFFGRYLHAETSARNFNWPQAPARVDSAVEDVGAILGTGATVGNPFEAAFPPSAALTEVHLNPATGLIDEFSENAAAVFRGGSRRNEDLLMTNVHEFKVELWDERLQRFVTPGHSYRTPAPDLVEGDYHISRCLNPGYSPRGNGEVFDTFNPRSAGAAPYIPYKYYPPLQNPNTGLGALSWSGPSPNTMRDPDLVSPELRSYWHENSSYRIGDVVFARSETDAAYLGWDFDGNGIFNWTFDAQAVPTQGFQIAYRCVAGNDLNGSGTVTFESANTPPVFPTAPSRRIIDGELTWESFDNRRPLQSVRVTVRFHDRNSDKMRQTSLILSVNDHTK